MQISLVPIEATIPGDEDAVATAIETMEFTNILLANSFDYLNNL